MTPLALSRENSSDIGFVVACLLAGAIDRGELQAWADHVLVTTESCPPYIGDLSTFDEPLSHIYRVIGFMPISGLADSEQFALIGIAIVRERGRFELMPTGEQALAALAKNPQIMTRFRTTFPFIIVEHG
jgi:hypothetical protein